MCSNGKSNYGVFILTFFLFLVVISLKLKYCMVSMVGKGSKINAIIHLMQMVGEIRNTGIKLDETNLFSCLFEWKFIIGMKEVKEKWCEIGNIWIEQNLTWTNKTFSV